MNRTCRPVHAAEENSVKPLIGKDKDGRPYRRPREVGEEIKAVLEWPLPQAFGLAAEGRLRPQPHYDSLVAAFFSRLQWSGEHLVRGMSAVNRERVHDLVKDKALKLMQSDRLDIFEMNFKTGAERLYLTAIAAVRLRAKTENPEKISSSPTPGDRRGNGRRARFRTRRLDAFRRSESRTQGGLGLPLRKRAPSHLLRPAA
jgi:hypothetical protein